MKQNRVLSSLLLATSMFLLMPTDSLGQQGALIPPSVSMCQLVKSPGKYSGQLVIVEAILQWKKRKQAYLRDFECQSTFLLRLPNNVSPRPGFDLVNDEQFQRLSRFMKRRYFVYVTLVGRFEAAGIGEGEDGKGPSVGFGSDGKWDFRFVLKEVRKAMPMPKAD